MTQETNPSRNRAGLISRAGLIFGLILLVLLLAVAGRFSEIDRLVLLAEKSRPLWLAVAFALQALTYVCLALGWRSVLACGGTAVPLARLLPVALAKLFADQTVPSGGLGGHLVTIERMRSLAVPRPLAMGAVLLTLVGYYASYAVLALVLLGVLWLNNEASIWLAGVVTIFLVVATAIPALALLLRRRGHEVLPSWLEGIGPLRRVLDFIALVPAELFKRRALIVRVTLLSSLIFVLDAATLSVCLMAAGEGMHPGVAFCAFMMASIASTLSPVPMGLGSFEATCVTMLTMLGIGLEPALAATLLLRGFTLWLPLLPGVVMMRGLRHLGGNGTD